MSKVKSKIFAYRQRNRQTRTEIQTWIILTGDATIHLEGVEASKGLSKAELMQYVDDPYWKKIRMLLFIAFWVLW